MPLPNQAYRFALCLSLLSEYRNATTLPYGSILMPGLAVIIVTAKVHLGRCLEAAR